MSAVQIDIICFEKGRERTILPLCILHQNNCSDDSTEVTEGVTSTPEIFGNKHTFVLTFFTTNTIYINCKRCKP